jgi:hypothetical protein
MSPECESGTYGGYVVAARPPRPITYPTGLLLTLLSAGAAARPGEAH